MESWLTTRQAAKAINASRSFIRKAIQAGRLRAANIGLAERAEWRIREGDLEEFMKAAIVQQAERVSVRDRRRQRQ